MVSKVFELTKELFEFTKKSRSDRFGVSLETIYLSDIFNTLNLMHLFFNGLNNCAAGFVSKVQAFVRQLDLRAMNKKTKP